MSQPMKNAATTVAPSTIHLQAGLVMFAGAAAAAFFGGGEKSPVTQAVTQPALVRRAAPLPAPAEAPTTQLLGYVDDAPQHRATTGNALQAIGIAAQPERRTAARIDAASMETERELPTAWRSPVLMAAAGPAPRATMRPYATTNDAAVRPGLTATPTNAPRKHVVRDGDTLGGLAEKYYGDARRYRELYAANRDVLNNPELLPIGVTLQIPAFDPLAVPTDVPAPTGARLLPQVLIRNP